MNADATDIEALNRDLGRHAAEEDWTALADGLARRDGLVRELVAGTSDPAMLARLLERLLADTRELMALAGAARDRVGAELRRLDEGRRAVQAYGDALPRSSRRDLAERAADAEA